LLWWSVTQSNTDSDRDNSPFTYSDGNGNSSAFTVTKLCTQLVGWS
jgi:hypothetical protein